MIKYYHFNPQIHLIHLVEEVQIMVSFPRHTPHKERDWDSIPPYILLIKPSQNASDVHSQEDVRCLLKLNYSLVYELHVYNCCMNYR